MTNTTVSLHCEMRDTCPDPVTMLDNKGFIYCTNHGLDRRSYGVQARKLRPFELRRLEKGLTVTRY